VWTIPSVRSATTRSITTPASVAVSTPTASSWRRMASRSARTATGRRAIPAAWSTMKPATCSRIRRCSSGLGSKMLIASSHHVAVPAQRFGLRPAPATTVQRGSGHQVLRRYGQPRRTRPDPPLGCRRPGTSRRCDRAARTRAHISTPPDRSTPSVQNARRAHGELTGIGDLVLGRPPSRALQNR
jgi:hypothetical protein